MATNSGTVKSEGKKAMLEHLLDLAYFELQAREDENLSVTLSSEEVTFDNPTLTSDDYYIDLSSNCELVIATGKTVGEIRLYAGANSSSTSLYATANISATGENDFPNGGSLIVTKFEIKVI